MPQVLFGGWLVFSLITTNAYRSSLIAHLTVLTKLRPINTFEDLLAQDDWTWGMVNASGSRELYFSTATDPIRMEVKRRMQVSKDERG